MKSFEFYSAGRIIFGSGQINIAGSLAREMGQKALIVATQKSLRKNGALNRLEKLLEAGNVKYKYFSDINGEPTVETVDEGVKFALNEKCDLVIGIGGGSCIDTAKAISGLVTNGGSALDYLEGVGSGAQILKAPLPYLAIPTTAGTGAEVTRNAVIASKTGKFKKSLRSPMLIPDIALVDPELTLSLPPKATAYSGMDALTQCIESYVSKKSQPFTDALALEGIRLAGRSLKTAFRTGNDLPARYDMALCSLLSGLSLANSGLGAAHGIGAALGAIHRIPHGLACAVMLPEVMKANFRTDIHKFARVGAALTNQNSNEDPEKLAQDGVDFINELAEFLQIPSKLNELGLKTDDIPEVAQNSGGSSMSGNPRELTEQEIINMLNRMF